MLSKSAFRCAAVLAAASVLCIPLLLLPGCDDSKPLRATGLTFMGQPILAGSLGKPLDRELRFRVTGNDEDHPDASLPIPAAPVHFRILSQPHDEAGAALSKSETATDAGGMARVAFTVGALPGIYRIEASLPDRPEIKPTIVVVLGGARIDGAKQDGWVGKTLDRRLAVAMESAPGQPLGEGEGLVRFGLMRAPEGTVLSSPRAPTDQDGVAATEIRLGNHQGKIEVGITILEGMPGNPSRLAPLVVDFFVIDGWSVAISIMGGLAIFLFGMKTMSESLQFVAGDKLRDLLNLLTRNRFMAVGAGALVTGLIQSSSACSVMVIGFVNAGLMQLEQAIGVIMGANIGTTVTAQIIALKLSALALPAVAVGVAVLLLAKRQATKYWAGIIIGFGLLFLGLNIMAEQLGELRTSSSIVALFSNLNSLPGPDGVVPFWPFLKAILCGIGVTVILQSSTATIGLLITIAMADLIDPYAAFGILLGDNIGTTITAVLASIGTSATAKRVACFHVTFNVLGVAIMILLNYVQWPGYVGRPVFMQLANIFTPGDVFRANENLPRFLANAHTLFNVSCTLLFIGFLPQFAKFCRWAIRPDPEGDDKADVRRILEPHLLATPSLALQQVWTEVGIMLEKAREAQYEGFRALVNAPAQEWNTSAREAKTLEKETDNLKDAITKYLGGISLTTLNENQSEMFPHLVRTVNDAEKVADQGKLLSKLAKRVNKRSLRLPDEAVAEMSEMAAIVDAILRLAEKTVNINADGIEMTGGGEVLRKKLLEDGKRLGKEAKAKANALRKNHERRQEEGLYDVKSGVVFLDVANSLARSAACAFNIIEAACHITGQIDIVRPGMSRRISIKSKSVDGQG